MTIADLYNIKIRIETTERSIDNMDRILSGDGTIIHSSFNLRDN
jgi:hypothetical protein